MTLTAESRAIVVDCGGDVSHGEVVLAGLRLGELASELDVDHLDAHVDGALVVAAVRSAHVRVLGVADRVCEVGDHF